jgi:hypothetical protein
VPSLGTIASWVNGLAAKTSSPLKKAMNSSRTAVAHGVTSRRRRRVLQSTALEKAPSRNTQSISEPSWEDQEAAAR